MDYNPRYLPLAIVSGVLLVTSITSTLLRCYVRKSIIKKFGADDWLILVSLVVFTGYVATVFLGGTYGVGLHESELSTSNKVDAYKVWWACYLAYGICITITRVSISLFFLRITVHKWHRYTIYFTLGWNCLAGFIYIFVVIFQCLPVEYYWGRKSDSGMQGKCIRTDQFVSLAYLYGAACAFCDLIFLALPLVLVWRLDIGWRRKVMLAPILGMTGFAGCCPLVRMAYLHNLASPDYLYATIDIAIWSVVESGLGITACSVATLRPLFRLAHVHISSFGRSYALRSLPNSYRNGRQGDGEAGYRERKESKLPNSEGTSPSGDFVFFAERDIERGESRTEVGDSDAQEINVRVEIEGQRVGENGKSWLVLDRRQEAKSPY